jgi:hypothetical protein
MQICPIPLGLKRLQLIRLERELERAVSIRRIGVSTDDLVIVWNRAAHLYNLPVLRSNCDASTSDRQ